MSEIKTGDVVRHKPSGERWLVAFCADGEVCCCGWPETYAKESDCEVLEVATEELRQKLLEQMKNSKGPRGEYARAVLAGGTQ